MSLSVVLSIYAAVLSTILAILNIIKFKQDNNKTKVKLSVEFHKKHNFDALVESMYHKNPDPFPPTTSASLYQVKIINRSDFSVRLDSIKVHSDLGQFSAYKNYQINGAGSYHSPISEDFRVEIPSKEYCKFDVVIPKGSESLIASKIAISTVCGKLLNFNI